MFLFLGEKENNIYLYNGEMKCRKFAFHGLRGKRERLLSHLCFVILQIFNQLYLSVGNILITDFLV